MRTDIHAKPSTSKSRLLAFTPALLATLMALPVQAAITVPKVPLQSGSAVAPNIMFILDDSGSMHGEIMPSDLVFDSNICIGSDGTVFKDCNTQGIGFVFPRASGVYDNGGGDDYFNLVANVDKESGYGAQVRSSAFNTIYYNPAITYTPWSKQDGTLYANASPTCALHNPERVGTGQDYCRDLTVVNANYNTTRWQDYSGEYCNEGVACLRTNSEQTFWPASYFNYDGVGDARVAASYSKVEINPLQLTYSGDGRAARTDCVAGVCTYLQEIQNFANWYTYYRSRILLARAGIGRAFATLPQVSSDSAPAPRVGFAEINKDSASIDGTNTRTLVTGVRPFIGTDRSTFFSNLYTRNVPRAGTPLRMALDDVGGYFERTDNAGPWGKVPGGSDTTAQLACRQNYAILMTDGYWNGDAASNPANGDLDSTDGTAIPRPAGATFSYKAASPFSDGRANTLADVAMYYWRTDLRTDLLNKVQPTSANPAYWQHMVTYGVGLGVTGSVDPSSAFAAIDSGATITWPDPSPDTANAAKVDDLLHAGVNSRGGFFSAANPTEFTSGLTKVLTSINERTASGSNVAANSVALKDETRIFQASFVPGKWTGQLESFAISAANGISATPDWSGSQGIPAVGTRKVFTWSSTGAATFPTTAQESRLTAAVAAYIKGDRSQERPAGALRKRDHLLGDIINSSPAYVKESATIFIGANDGMLHAFDAEGAGKGTELFAFIPNAHTDAELDRLKTLSDPAYGHDYFVDGPVMVSSFTETPAKNYLVGSLGRGGKGVYFLDVTDPVNFGTTNITGQYIGASTGNENGTTADDAKIHMGNSFGRPLIANVALGTNQNNLVKTPVAIVSNGINSTTGSATLFVFNLATGAYLKHIVASNVANSDEGNGLSSPRGWDLDGDTLIDYVYAGDLKGNVWKFDLSGNAVADWKVHPQGNPLFVATDGTNRQPITGGLSVAMDPSTFKPWVFFGTGKYIETTDLTSTAVQSFYGIKDLDVAVGARGTNLVSRGFSVTGATIDGLPVRAFDASATLDPTKKGWYVDLPAPTTTPPTAAERMVGDPFLLGTVLVAASIVPNADPCDAGGTGFINAIDAFTGTSVQNPFFDVDGDGSFDDDRLTSGQTTVPVGSVNLGIAMPTSPTVVESLLVAGGSLGTTAAVKVNNPLLKGRISWREIVRD